MQKETLQKINIIILFSLFTLVGYFAGRLATHVEAVYESEPIKFLDYDINEKVPFVQINKITNGIMEGNLMEKDVRIVFGDDTIVSINEDRTFNVDVSKIINVVDIQIPQGMHFVASKKGTKVYPVDSSSGNKIKPENRIYFATEAEAIDLGFKT